MIRCRIIATVAAFLAAAVVLSGCMQNDRFANDAVQYNREAEKAQDRVILLNVLRASYRRPFEFSGVQTITGAASASGQIGFTVPLAQNGGTTASTFSPQISRSAGPTVTVGVVDTQDFYEGLLKPIAPQLIDLYVQRGIPKTVLFSLFFSNISVTQNDAVVAPFTNAVGSRADFDKFEAFLDYLVSNAKLTTESVDKPKPYGPLLTAGELANRPNFAATAATAGLDWKEMSWCDLSVSDIGVVSQRLRRRVDVKKLKKAFADHCAALKKLPPVETDADQGTVDDALRAIQNIAIGAGLPAALYRAQKANTEYHLCFEVPEANGGAALCSSDKKSRSAASVDLHSVRVAAFGRTSPAGRQMCDAAKIAYPQLDCTIPIGVSFTVRSTYGIIYYLGEVVRESLNPDGWSTKPGYLAEIKVGSHDNTSVPLFDLVDLSQTELDKPFLKVEYAGKTYAVPDHIDSETNEVLDVVAELVALNKSAKDLPTSSVITAVGVP